MHTLTLAADVLASASTGPSWDTGLLAVIAGIMKFVAVLVVLFAAVKGTKDAQAGKVGKAIALIAGCALIVTVLWEPSLINKIIELFSGVTDKGVDNIDTIIQDSGGVTGGDVKG